jgi:hypothetical protein
MYKGASSGDFAQNSADKALKRIAALEEALCGLCQTLATNYPTDTRGRRPMHPQLLAWYESHKSHPGCEMNK